MANKSKRQPPSRAGQQCTASKQAYLVAEEIVKGGQSGGLSPDILARLADAHNVPQRFGREHGKGPLARAQAPQEPCEVKVEVEVEVEVEFETGFIGRLLQ